MERFDIEEFKCEIVKTLKSYEDEFVTGDNLIKMVGLKSKGALRNMINELRQEANPIVAGSAGYKYSTDVNEVVMYSQSLYNRADEQMKAYRGLVVFLTERGYRRPE